MTPDAMLGVLDMFDWFKKSRKKKRTSADDLVDKIKAAGTVTKAPVKSEKELATEAGEPYVAVLRMEVDPNNLHQGAFELDWNEHFITELKKSGYGFDGDPDEEMVDRWFRDLAANMLAEAGQDPSRHNAGYINVTK